MWGHSAHASVQAAARLPGLLKVCVYNPCAANTRQRALDIVDELGSNHVIGLIGTQKKGRSYPENLQKVRHHDLYHFPHTGGKFANKACGTAF